MYHDQSGDLFCESASTIAYRKSGENSTLSPRTTPAKETLVGRALTAFRCVPSRFIETNWKTSLSVETRTLPPSCENAHGQSYVEPFVTKRPTPSSDTDRIGAIVRSAVAKADRSSRDGRICPAGTT